MSVLTPRTPEKQLPGTFLNTPAPNRQTANFGAPRMQNASQDAVQSRQRPGSQQIITKDTSQMDLGRGMTLIERAASTINATLDAEGRYPPLDNYISQGSSNDYSIPSSPAWAPFQKIRMYDIPDKIFEQYNQAQVSTMMGLFAEFNHAWISIDNSLYLWDYTHPNPELIGFEEQPNSITAVKLVVPRPGVFVSAISRLLVVATTSDIILIGVSTQGTQSGAKSMSLYQTRMQVSIKGISVHCIAGSPKTGRIFFAGRGDDDVHELTYQQEEKWFQNRCAKVNHTRKGFQTVIPTLPFQHKVPHEHVSQIIIDDTRNLFYTLSSRSTIRIFYLSPPNTLGNPVVRAWPNIFTDLGHKVSNSPLLTKETTIVSISSISAKEASRLNLVATTNTGCRVFFSLVTGSFYGASSTNAPSSMQVHHVKFPPPDHFEPQATQQAPSNQSTISSTSAPGGDSRSLTQSRLSERFPPGYFLCFVQKGPQTGSDILFLSVPDSGRIAHPQDPALANRLWEFGMWVMLESHAEDVGLVTPSFAASSNPQGFGNELAVQFDQPSSEIAVLTNTGVQTYRRRRLVDVFAAAIRYGGSDEGLDGETRSFVRMYGRGETIASAIAVACGQGSEITVDARVAKVTDPEILERARKAFIDHGGKPILNENSVVDQSAPAIDNVRPSPRHEGLALYISRLLRSIWKAPIIQELATPAGGLQVVPTIPQSLLQSIQRDLVRLQEFLNANRTFIEGLAGPEALGRVSTKHEEIALQGEHRALNSLVHLISDVIEGISFVLVLFEERVDEIFLSIPDASRQQARQMTYERLFCTAEGKDLAKELVKAIVNRNIAQGSNVDTVTDALRRKCGSFCSADDCVIFKAQEQLKRASDTSSSSEPSRNLLNESLRLLQRVAASLSTEQLRWALEQYISMDFYAGAIQLALSVAQENDRGNRALAWFNEGSPPQDSRVVAFESRTRCYDMVHDVINAVDRAASQAPEMVDDQYTVTAKRKREAYEVINNSQDELFQINLYDWYLSQGWNDRLLGVKSAFVVNYLQRRSLEDVARADLLWKYYAHYNSFLEAASVQLQLAQSSFPLTLEQRIEYLSRARANASTRTVGITEMGRSRLSRQELVREISDLLDIANIQEDLLQRIRADSRLTADRRPEVIKQLNGEILPIDDLYNGYADQASYYDICLLIYQIADYRSSGDVHSTWQNLLEQIHQETEAVGESLPYEAVSERVRALGTRLNLSESTFPIATLLPMLERYAFEYQRLVGPPTWVVDTFLDLSVPYESLISTLEAMFYNDEIPFRGKNRKYIATDMFHVIQRWFAESSQMGIKGALFGGEENARVISQTLGVLAANGLDERQVEEASVLKTRIEHMVIPWA